MKYWLLTSEYPPFFGGGISTYCSFTASMMSKNGHDVTVFVNDDTVKDCDIELRDNVRLIRFNPGRTGSSAFLGHTTNISYEFAAVVKHFIEKEGKPDIIEAQEYLGIAYYLLQFKHLGYSWCYDVRIVITMHSPSFLYMEYNQVPMYRYPNYWICEMERFCLQAADHVISPSQYMVDELSQRFSLSHGNLSVIPNPFLTVQDLDVEEQKPGEADQIIFYGKLTVQKGALKLLEYFRQLWESGFDRPLYLLGGQDIVYHPEGISMGDLIRKKYRKYLQKGLLKMEGRITPSDVKARLALAEVVIIPSNNDNLPYVAFEMMALGKILLVSKQGGHSEVIRNGKEGFIFDHTQPATFREQLMHILTLSKEERNNISLRARKRVADDYGQTAVYKPKIELLEQIISRQQDQRLFPYVRARRQQAAILSKDYIPGMLSIVIPYYNMGSYIGETISSIQASIYKDWEIIIVNDGSTEDNSVRKLNEYRNQAQMRVIDILNQGLGHARNLGAMQAKGEYLAFLDADDTVENSYYSKAIKALSECDNIHFVGSWTRYTGDSFKTWPGFQPEPPMILYHNLTNSSSLVYKRNSFLSGGLNDEIMVFTGLEDYNSVVSMLESGYNGVVLPESLFNYRVRADSMFRGISRDKKLLLYQGISEAHNGFYANFAADLFNLLNANGPGIFMDNPSLDHHLADKIPFGGKLSLRLIKMIKKNKRIRTLAYKVYRAFNK